MKEFSLEYPKYNQNTFYGRWKYFQEMIHPKLLFKTNIQLKEAQDLLNLYERGLLDRTNKDINNKLWDAKQLIQSMIHPQTGEIIPIWCRLTYFIPVNIPICAGMILTKPTIKNIIFWQWINQSYNAAFNYANRNTTSNQDNYSILKAYASATIISCGTAVGMGKIISNFNTIHPIILKGLQKTIPFFAVAAAGASNAILMRMNELTEGIDIVDKYGDNHGKSIIAGKKCLTEVALTRIALPLPILLFPPYILQIIKKVNMLPSNKYAKSIIEIGVISSCLWGAFPAAVALFPQKSNISSNVLEFKFNNKYDKNNNKIDTFYYNKGI